MYVAIFGRLKNNEEIFKSHVICSNKKRQGG